jgi:hypothetical protein
MINRAIVHILERTIPITRWFCTWDNSPLKCANHMLDRLCPRFVPRFLRHDGYMIILLSSLFWRIKQRLATSLLSWQQSQFHQIWLWYVRYSNQCLSR